MEASEDIPEVFSVEQGFVITMAFFLTLWPLVESRITEEERLYGTYTLFFREVCYGEECSAEWNEAIRRAINILKEEQRTLRLSQPEIFLSALEFCKLHNERYKGRITYAVHLLELMKKNPEQYPAEWAIWQKAVQDGVHKYTSTDYFDWSAELPTWPDKENK